MEDGHQSSQTSTTFDLLWNTLNANDGETHLQNEVSFSTTENGQMYNSLDFQVDGIDIPNFLAFPSQPQTFRPSIDSGAPPSEMSEMTTSPGALSIQSPPPQDGLTCQNGPTLHNDPAYQNNGPVQNGAASQVLPSNTVWTGDHDFNYSLETCGEHAEKSISWTYSPTLGKLFVDREKNCPINFRTSKQPPPETVLRVLPIFQKSGSIQEVVKRCPHHMGQGVDHSAHHIVICQDPSASYETDPTTGRHSLVLPFQKPQAGNSSLQFLFTFKCFMSCVGGLNRRPIQLIFTLENRGQIIGRQVLDTRICACPGRDRKSEEKNKEKPKKGTKRSKQVTQTVAITSLKKKKKTEPKDTEIFLLRVEGRQRYETLVKLNEALDLFDMATPEQKAEQKARQDKIKKMPLTSLSTYSSSSQSSQGSTIVQAVQPQNPPPPQQVVQPAAHPMPQMLMVNQPAQQATTTGSYNGLSTVTQADLSDLLGTQAFDPTMVHPPIGLHGQHSYTQLQAVPSLCRGDTIPTLSTLSPSLQQYLIAVDQPDGPQAMDVTSSQQQSPPGNNMVSPTASENQVTSSMDKSIHGWLDSVGFGKYRSIFQENGYHTIDSLDEISLEFFNEAGIPHSDREAMWKHILAHRQRQDSLKGTPPLQRIRSDASTISNISQTAPGSQGQFLRATRYTLKQTLSFKVKEEEESEEEEA